MNYPTLPRSGLLALCLLRVGSSERPKVSRDHERRAAPFERLPVSASVRASDVDTASTRRRRLVRPIRTRSVPRTAPDSAGGFPSRAVRSVPLLPVRHSAITDGACFSSSIERATLSRDVARILRILAACRTWSGNVGRTRRVLTASGKSPISRNDETAKPFRTTFERRRKRSERRTTLFSRQVVTQRKRPTN